MTKAGLVPTLQQCWINILPPKGIQGCRCQDHTGTKNSRRRTTKEINQFLLQSNRLPFISFLLVAFNYNFLSKFKHTWPIVLFFEAISLKAVWHNHIQSVVTGNILLFWKRDIEKTQKTILLYTYWDWRTKKDRDKNSLFALEKPADWSYDFFH